jgi:Fe-coproporphyrin III synthase
MSHTIEKQKAENVPLVIDKGFRIIQIHPTLKCNLTCVHCYSSSAPHLKAELSLSKLKSFLEEAALEGYNAISLSGGEPFLYAGLAELLVHAKSLGFYNAVTTNGMLFERHPKNIAMLEHIDFLAMSIDGEAEQHNFMRNSPKAFKGLLEGIEIVKNEMSNYGFIHTVTPTSFASLLWLGDFVQHHSGKLLQLHPIENIGRGQKVYEALSLQQDILHKINILTHYLKKKHEGQMLIELDLLHRDQIIKKPQIVYAHSTKIYPRITDNLRELILDEKGNLIPISHGFAGCYQIGNLSENIPFSSMAARFLENTFSHLQRIFDETYADIAANEEIELLNWAEIVVHNSHQLVS